MLSKESMTVLILQYLHMGRQGQVRLTQCLGLSGRRILSSTNSNGWISLRISYNSIQLLNSIMKVLYQELLRKYLLLQEADLMCLTPYTARSSNFTMRKFMIYFKILKLRTLLKLEKMNLESLSKDSPSILFRLKKNATAYWREERLIELLDRQRKTWLVQEVIQSFNYW